MTNISDDERAAISDIVHGARTALFTTVSGDGELHARPLAVLDKAFDGTLRFLVRSTSDLADDIARNQNVNVAIESQGGYLSIAGTAEISDDDELIDELWSPFAEAWFPNGRQDPEVRVLLVRGGSVEYWTRDSGVVGSLVRTVRAAISKQEQPDLGRHGTVEV